MGVDQTRYQLLLKGMGAQIFGNEYAISGNTFMGILSGMLVIGRTRSLRGIHGSQVVQQLTRSVVFLCPVQKLVSLWHYMYQSQDNGIFLSLKKFYCSKH